MKIKQGFSNVPNFFESYLITFFKYLKGRLKDDLISLILYGSIARETWHKESDIDLLLILSDDFFKKYNDYKISELIIDFYDKNRKNNLYKKYEFHTLQILSLSIEDLRKFRTLFYDIAIDGIILFDTKEVGLSLIEKYQKRIEEKALRRVYINENDFYWKRNDIKFGEIIEL